MYRHGLGDCFLLSFPKEENYVHVMIDCGIVLGTSEPNVVMKQVAENVKLASQGKVDVLIITHEHWDHLSGFDPNQARTVFDQIDFGALWLAWTEEEGNPVATEIREEREKKKKAALKAKEAAEQRGQPERAARLAGLLGFFGAKAAGTGGSEEAESGGGTSDALAYLKKKCTPTIVETGGKPLSIPGLDGVRVYVLGPPLNRAALKKTNPHKGEGYGLGGNPIGLTDAFLAAFDPADEQAQPFAHSLRQPTSEMTQRFARVQSDATQRAVERTSAAGMGEPACRVESPSGKPGIDWYQDPENAWRSIDDAWLATGDRLALQMDNATNNTSLVLAFEFEGSNDVLLFVGDAQAGNWRSWDDHRWTVKGKNGDPREVTPADLLKNTIFYKVGHHGSHNATLREKGLERMTSNRLAAVIPVDTKVAHEVKGWEEMPLPAIQERLKERCAVIFQSDRDPLEIKKLPELHWVDSVEKFDVRMRNKVTKEVETDRKQPLYTDFFV